MTTQMRNDIALWLAKNEPAWPSEVATALGLDRGVVTRRMATMAESGELVKDQHGGYRSAFPPAHVVRFISRKPSPDAIRLRLMASRADNLILPLLAAMVEEDEEATRDLTHALIDAFEGFSTSVPGPDPLMEPEAFMEWAGIT